MSKKQNEFGNTVTAQAVFEREVQHAGKCVYNIAGFAHRASSNKFVVRSIRFRSSVEPGGEWMVIISAYSPNGPVVAFHSGAGFKEALVGLATRLMNGSLVWKEDKYG